ncbi:hypothetical protein ACHAWF_014925 [Thalassiosira exigua]
MHPDRCLQAAIGVAFAFALLWTVGVLVGDDGFGRSYTPNRSFTAPQQFGLVINGSHYVLDTNLDQEQTREEDVHVIHLASPTTASKKRKGALTSRKPRKLKTQPTFQITSESSATNNDSSSQHRAPLFPKGAWFAVFILYRARRFFRRRQTFEDDWFVKSKLDASLQYYGVREYEEDFLSVDGSYGSTWNGEQLNKFDV